jgi:ATP-dependent exoDNAse (exonuclease V) beta subunit
MTRVLSESPDRLEADHEDSDLWARREALDPYRSFIVQAPAGSGKTGLLTQRYLKLLSGVSVPEEILALTFTKKAAGEMRDRILEALYSARTKPRPEGEHEALSWDLATAVLVRDARFNWRVEENPQRLQVVTIDSLCSRLGHALPILSQFGASPQPVDDAQPFYQEAARRTLAHLDDPESPCQAAVAHLLLHLDNDLRRVGQQVATLLERRDRWMRPLLKLRSDDGFADLDGRGREALEAALQRVVRQELSELREAFPNEALYQLTLLLRDLASRYDPDHSHPLHPWLEHQGGLPGTEPEDAKLWKSLRVFLLISKGDWRKSVTVKLGFLPEKETKDRDEKAQRKADKARMRAILAELCDQEGLRRRLHDVASLPPVSYSDAQWATLRALLQVSVVAAAELLLVFKSWAKADFVEVAQRAERALGSDEEPTEIAMALDAKLQHILVDEFQDTSLGQLRLLERLTAEWTSHERRTLFLVGDPMQSIYRFRDAEVGLFLRIRQEGLPNLGLDGLRLRKNFRSQTGLVEWFNDVFSQVFPPLESPTTGSVPYSTAEAARAPGDDDPVQVHPILVDSWGDPAGKQREADQVVEILRSLRRQDPGRRVAILTRSRGHLETILPTLRREGFRYQGVDLEPLESRPVVRDLLALTRALAHPADRVAWLSVLRAPWCGLTSDDLHTVADDQGEGTIYDRLCQLAELSPLTESGRLRLDQVRRVLGEAVSQRRRLPLRRWVESVWLSLGGPATLESRSDLEDAQAYLGLLDRLGEEHSRPDLHLLEQRIAKLYAQPDVQADGNLQVMTIHKSKGLQFDTVILPGLSQPPRPSEEPLLSWLERATPDGGSDLLLAPITEKGDKERDAVYRFVNSLEKKKEENELARLLYVAATRAERQLHLVTRVAPASKSKDFGELKEPPPGSFLGMLWPALRDEIADLVAPQFAARPRQGAAASPFDPSHPWAQEPTLVETAAEAPLGPPPVEVRRLCDDWVPPPTPPSVDISAVPRVVDLDLDDRPSFEWAGENAKRVGSVVHRVLQQMGREGLAAWPVDRLGAMRPFLESSLSAAGVPEAALQVAVVRAQSALSQVLESPRGRWIFEQGGEEARSEYAISGVSRGRLVRAVVDRTFVDDQGVRWVVDYKTGIHEGGDTEAFLDAEMERYKPQLERYAALLAKMDGRPVKMGLYFPLLGGWREWS